MSTPAIPQAVLDVLLDASTAFATAVMDAQASLTPEGTSATPKVGDTITPEQAKALPVGAEVCDREGDIWVRREDGGFGWRGADYTTDLRIEGYAPLTVESLPEPEPESAPEPTTAFSRGDEVTITGLSEYGADNIGRTGTVGNPAYMTGTVEVFVNGIEYVYKPSNLTKVAPATPAAEVTPAAPIEVTIATGNTEVFARPSMGVATGARVEIRSTPSGMHQYGVIHLSATQTRQLAATLTAIADLNRSF